ncbi:MAG: hypothetical protein ACRCWY_05115 [Cellulosilyticaceae bacterium]
MIKTWIIRFLIVICAMCVVDSVITTSTEVNNQEIVCMPQEGIPSDELHLWVKEVVDYEDQENKYKVGTNNHLIAITFTIQNQGDRDVSLTDRYAPVSLVTRPYGDCEVITMLGDGYEAYDLRSQEKEMVIPIGRTREVTYLVEMHNEAIALDAEEYEYETNTRYTMEIPF